MVFEIFAAYLGVFLFSYFITKVWIKMAKKADLVGKDMNKENGKNVAEAGGVAVVMSFFLAVLGYVFIKSFFLNSQTNLVETFSLLLTVSLATSIGFVDDVLGWKIGLRQWQKPLLGVLVAIPLVVINAGTSVLDLPVFGAVDFGILYPLLIIPIAIIGASNGFNMIAGLNGLESGMGIVILSALGVASYLSSQIWLTLLIFAMVVSLLGFLMWNKFPGKVFPGDSLTYSVGALIAGVAILGELQKLAVILFIPYFIEFVLKVRSKFKAESFGKVKNGKLYRPYDKIYSLTHVFMTGRTEKQIVLLLILVEMVIAIWGLLYFYW